ncbi:hypothetical protein C8R45DRAFT_1182673 [Mycena sanguinolenta]|nr:hypothetical protein C8R45DRAFT_1182673 [Mycena sanguinolenta]
MWKEQLGSNTRIVNTARAQTIAKYEAKRARKADVGKPNGDVDDTSRGCSVGAPLTVEYPSSLVLIIAIGQFRCLVVWLCYAHSYLTRRSRDSQSTFFPTHDLSQSTPSFDLPPRLFDVPRRGNACAYANHRDNLSHINLAPRRRPFRGLSSPRILDVCSAPPFSEIPREELLFGPSPVYFLDQMTPIWANREARYPELACGRNKTRKREYLLADALAQSCYMLVHQFRNYDLFAAVEPQPPTFRKYLDRERLSRDTKRKCHHDF